MLRWSLFCQPGGIFIQFPVKPLDNAIVHDQQLVAHGPQQMAVV